MSSLRSYSLPRQDKVAISLHNVCKEFRLHNCRDRWLRREIVDTILGRRKEPEKLSVIKGVDLTIERGETVAILGRNGCGKSTLLRLMAGILQPTSGRVSRHGSVCAVFDACTGFHPDLTGRENVFINGTILGLSERYLQSIMTDVEYFSELEGFMDTPTKYYSSGMTARLGFAVAMCADPDIFLIDEVLAVGDEGFRIKCLKRLGSAISQGVTAVIVTHDTYSVRSLFRRGIWLDGGAIRMDGPIDEVCDEYMSYFYGKQQADVPTA